MRRAWRFGSVMALSAAFATSALADPPRPRPTRPAASANASPEEHVKRAQAAFDDQDYEKALALAKPAAENATLSAALRERALRIVAFAAITLSRPAEAEAAVRAIYTQNERFELPETESPKFRTFFRDVRDRMKRESGSGNGVDTASSDANARPPHERVTLKHTPPAQVESGAHLDVAVRIEDAARPPSRVVLHVRDAADVDFEEIDLDVDGATARGSIPARAIRGAVLEYYFVALDDRQHSLGEDPSRDAPYRVPVITPSRGWILPVAIGGGVLAVGAVLGGLALAGVFDKSAPPRNSVVTVRVTE